ncbi:DUF4232 domain-containing protein [Streptomyces sp. NPDC006435]|uniref:DUF4232 domain-containing protein n=1 Tax=Streptomyces sp. NPDC006435 TaxID=3154300 RepID=UPI0033B00F25
MRTLRTRKNTAALGVVTAVLTLALTACNGDDGTQSAGTAGSDASATASTDTSKTGGASKGTDSEGTSKTGGSSQNAGSSQSAGSSSGKSDSSGGSAASGGGNTSDSYAYKHPCKSDYLSFRVYPREGSTTQHVIEVNNIGADSCGLSYFPQVSLGAENATDHSGDIKPAVPGGLGGAPAYAVKPGTAAIAVIDLNPGGKNGVTWVNEMSVLADGEHMANADTQNFPLGPDVKVDNPKLGLYQSSIAEAVSSMESAG